jgi:hypothetical protein
VPVSYPNPNPNARAVPKEYRQEKAIGSHVQVFCAYKYVCILLLYVLFIGQRLELEFADPYLKPCV